MARSEALPMRSLRAQRSNLPRAMRPCLTEITTAPCGCLALTVQLQDELAADDDEGGGEGQAQDCVGNAARHVAAEENAGQRAGEQRADQVPVDRAHDPMADAGKQSERHGMSDVRADDAR